MFHIVTAQVTNFFKIFFDQWEWRNHFNCEAKKMLLGFFFVWVKKNEIIGFRTTVLLKALFTLLIYYIVPLTTEGYWCFF